MLMSIVVSYGYHLNGPKQISILNDINKEVNLIKNLVSLRLFIAIVISLIIIAFTITKSFFNNYKLIILFSIPILFSEAVHPVFYLQGKNNLSILAILNAISKIIYLALIVITITNPDDAFKVNLIYGSVLLIIYLLYWILFFQKKKLKIDYN